MIFTQIIDINREIIESNKNFFIKEVILEKVNKIYSVIGLEGSKNKKMANKGIKTVNGRCVRNVVSKVTV